MLVMTIIQRRRSCTVTTSGMEDTEDGAAWLAGRGNGASVETEDSPGTKEIQTDIDRDRERKRQREDRNRLTFRQREQGFS